MTLPNVIALSRPGGSTQLILEAAFSKRRTSRQYSDSALTLADLSALLWAAQGVTGDSGQRTTPSAGAQYPLSLYVAVGSVSDLPSGLYEFDVARQALIAVSGDDLRDKLCAAALEDQPWVSQAAVVIIVVADFGSLGDHFAEQPPRGERGARYAYIETGALAQNVHLQAGASELGFVLVGGFDDASVRSVLNLPAGLGPTALLCVGRMT